MSISVHFHQVSFTHLTTIQLFKNLSMHLDAQWTGVVGGNGAGKSTLLQLIDGTILPQHGQVDINPEQAIVHRCPQRVEHCTPAIEAFAHCWDNDALKLKSTLDLNYEQYDIWDGLSPGQRKRWQIGAALWSSPDILLLDEPTNHLDSKSREQLLSALWAYEGMGIIVSHDRGFLDELTQTTVRIEPDKVYVFALPYGEAEEQFHKMKQTHFNQHMKLKYNAKRADRKLVDQREQTQKADQRISAGSRLKNHRDSDARSVNRKARAMNAANKFSRQGRAQRKQAERLHESLANSTVEKPLGSDLFIDYQASFKPMLVAYQDQQLDLGPDTPVLLKDVNLCVQRHDRIHLRGPNGVGKTTLLKALMEHALIPYERILYLPQTMNANQVDALMLTMQSIGSKERGRVYQIVAALGVDPKRLIQSEHPSPGEARKLALALGMSQSAWLLMLDEPTNHLDLPSIERLEAALFHYPGAMVLISHDDFFARQCTQTVWHFNEGQLKTTSALHATR